LIHEISNACRETPLFKDNKERYREFKKEFDNSEDKIVESYTWFMERIVSAPTRIHMISSVRLCLPIVDDFIQEAKGE
jgi:hypothetical protein